MKWMAPCSPCLRGESELISQMRLGLRVQPALCFCCVVLWLKSLNEMISWIWPRSRFPQSRPSLSDGRFWQRLGQMRAPRVTIRVETVDQRLDEASNIPHNQGLQVR